MREACRASRPIGLCKEPAPASRLSRRAKEAGREPRDYRPAKQLRGSKRARLSKAFKPIKTFKACKPASAYRRASQKTFRQCRQPDVYRRCRRAKGFRAAIKMWGRARARTFTEWTLTALSGRRSLRCTCPLLAQFEHRCGAETSLGVRHARSNVIHTAVIMHR